MNNQGWIHYWRNSLADADSERCIKKQDLKIMCERQPTSSKKVSLNLILHC